MYFSAYEVAKVKLGIVEHSDSHEPVKTAAAGVAATTLSDLIMVPMETIKQRMQLNIRPYSSERAVAGWLELSLTGFLFLQVCLIVSDLFCALKVLLRFGLATQRLSR